MTNKPNVNKMFETLTEADDTQVNQNNNIKKRRKTNALLLAGTSILLISGIAGALILFSPKGQTIIQKTNTIQTNVATQQDSNITDEHSVTLPNWAYNHYNDKRQELREGLMTSLDSTAFGNMITNFPSEQNGFTSDSSKEIVDGLPNLYYTTATQEDIRFYTLSYLNRIINPIYGSWTEYQYGDQRDANNVASFLYSDMFSENFIKNNELPFRMDKEKNGFGLDWDNSVIYKTPDGETRPMKLKPRWIGELTSIDNMEVSPKFDAFTVKGKYNLYAYTSKGKVTETYSFTMKLSVSKRKTTEKNKIVVEEWTATKE